MDICKYCGEIFDDSDSKDIFFKHINMSLNDKIVLNLMDVTLWITDEAKMELFIDAPYEDGTIVKETVSINFCPFCGRRLRNE